MRSGSGAGAAGGGGGRTEIVVGLEPGLRASIVNEAANAGVALATDHAQQDTKFSRSVRRLTA